MSVSDLTGTTWKINASPSVSTVYDAMKINFQSNGSTFSHFLIGYGAGAQLRYGTSTSSAKIVFFGGWRSGDVPWNNASSAYEVLYDQSPWPTITIIDGQDVTNSTLIAWLEANATYQEPVASSDISFGSLSISDIIFATSGSVSKIFYGSTLVYSKNG